MLFFLHYLVLMLLPKISALSIHDTDKQVGLYVPINAINRTRRALPMEAGLHPRYNQAGHLSLSHQRFFGARRHHQH